MTFRELKKYYKEDRKPEMESWAKGATTKQLIGHDMLLSLGIFTFVIPIMIAGFYAGVWLGKAIFWLVDKISGVPDHVKFRNDMMKDFDNLTKEYEEVKERGFRV